jgi:transcriptional regulator with XRE-family HTH domain
MSRRKKDYRWIDPQAFRDLRKQLRMTRKETAKALDVTERTVQNWENSGARIPWMAYKLLRLLRGIELPGQAWEGWTVRGDTLYSPDGRAFPGPSLYHLEHTFAMARLWRDMYSAGGKAKTAQTVLPFPDRRKTNQTTETAQVAQKRRMA